MTGAPAQAAARFQAGLAHRSAGRLAAALDCFSAVTALDPHDAMAHNACAAVFLDLKRPAEALASASRALEVAPAFAGAHSNRGAALRHLKRLSEALESCNRALMLQPDHFIARLNQAAVLLDLQRLPEALDAYDSAIRLRPDFAEAYANRAGVLQQLLRPLEALADCERALRVDPRSELAHVNRGGVLHDMAQFDAALESYAQAQRLQSDSRAFVNSAFIHLQRGQFGPGWELFEHRRQPGPGAGRESWPVPACQPGEALAGRTLFLYWEQGLGDTLQFCRYASMAAQRGARVLFSVQTPLREILGGLGPVELLGQDEMPHNFDLRCPLLSLPRVFGTSVTNIPAQVPYLAAAPERVAHWRARLGHAGFRIAIAWQGNPHKSIDAGRSYPLHMLKPLAALPDVRLISIQKGHGVEQLKELPPGMKVEQLGDEFDSGPSAFLDSAAVIAAVDLVITSDTAIAHLAGALGRPVWILLKYVPDWRWLLERRDSPWYPTARLYRQAQPGDWESVLRQVQVDVAEAAMMRRSR
jgi:tetratricopeptide (TPR) repeat protein